LLHPPRRQLLPPPACSHVYLQDVGIFGETMIQEPREMVTPPVSQFPRNES
jgi:hypothetical protein